MAGTAVDDYRAERMPGVGAASEQRMQRRASGQSGGVGRDPLDDLHGVFRQGNPAVGDLPAPRIAVVPRSTRGDLRKGQPRNARLHGPGRHPDRARDEWHDADTARRRYAQGLCARRRRRKTPRPRSRRRSGDSGPECLASARTKTETKRRSRKSARNLAEILPSRHGSRRSPSTGLTPKRRTLSRRSFSKSTEAKVDLHGRIPAVHMPFRDLTGHRRLLELTAGAALRGSLPPSLIFAGPEGVGKRHAAIALAQFVNCPAPGRTRCLRRVRILLTNRTRGSSRCAAHRTGRNRLHPDRAGPRCHRPLGLPPVRGQAPRRHCR